MSEPESIHLTNVEGFEDRLQVEGAYEARQRAREDVEWDALLESSATAAETMPKQIEPPAEALDPERARQFESVAQDPAGRQVLDRLFRVFTGQPLEAIETAVKTGTLGQAVSLRLLDPLGNVAEDMIREEGMKEGLAPDLVERLAVVGPMLLGLFRKGGQARRASEVFRATPGKTVIGAGAATSAKPGASAKTLAETLLAASPTGEVRLNLERIGAADEVKRAMANVNALLEERLGKSRERVGHAAQIEGAKKYTLGDLLGPIDEDFAAKVTAVRDASVDATAYAAQVAKAVLGGKPEAGKDLWGAFALAVELSARDELMGRLAARGLEIRKVLSDAERSAIDPAKIGALARQIATGVGLSTEDLATALLALDGQAQRAGFLANVAKVVKAGTGSIYEVWINWLLSGPQTHVVNTLSGVSVIPVAIADRAAAARVGQVMKAFGLSPGVEAGETQAMLFAIPAAAQDGFKMLRKFWQLGESFGGEKVERAPAFVAEAFGAAKDSYLGRGIDYLGQAATLGRAPTKLLGVEDAFFKGFNYRLELEAQAVRLARRRGLTGADAAALKGEIIANPEKFPEIHEAAKQFALVQTFTNELGTVGSAFKRFADTVPGGRIIAPFVATPTNLVTYMKAHGPLAPIGAKFWRDVASRGAARDLALGQMAAGSLVISALIPIVLSGRITGKGTEEPETRRALRGSGGERPQYAAQIGETAYSYNRLDPVGMTIGLVADYVEIAGQVPEGQRLEMAAALLLAVKDNLLSKTYLRGVSDFVEAMTSSDRRMETWVKSLARSTVPTAIRTLERTVDPALRETQTLFDEIRAGIPGLSSSLPPRRNLFADPILLEGGMGPDLISPIYTTTVKDDPVGKEMARVGVRLSMPTKVVFGTRPPALQMEPQSVREGVELTLWEYDRLVQFVGLGGQAAGRPEMSDEMREMPTLRAQLQALFATEEYRQATDGPEGGKALLIGRVVERRKVAARAELMRHSPGLEDLLKARIADRVRALGASEAEITESLGR